MPYPRFAERSSYNVECECTTNDRLSLHRGFLSISCRQDLSIGRIGIRIMPTQIGGSLRSDRVTAKIAAPDGSNRYRERYRARGLLWSDLNNKTLHVFTAVTYPEKEVCDALTGETILPLRGKSIEVLQLLQLGERM